MDNKTFHNFLVMNIFLKITKVKNYLYIQGVKRVNVIKVTVVNNYPKIFL